MPERATSPERAGGGERDAVPGALFVYGTLARPLVLDRVLERRHGGERLRARLAGFRRVEDERFPYPYLVEEPGAVADGVLVLDLSTDDFVLLDAYEDVERGLYTRLRVRVEAWGCGPGVAELDAETYVAGPRLRARLGLA